MTQVASTHGLAVHSGRMELELRPPLHVDKGTVVHQLADELGGRLRQVGVFGDDLGDLPAFERWAAWALPRPRSARCASPRSTPRARRRWRSRPISRCPARPARWPCCAIWSVRSPAPGAKLAKLARRANRAKQAKRGKRTSYTVEAPAAAS